MRLRTVIKLGTVVSVALFCIAVGFYAFMRLDASSRNRDANLFSLVPDDCISVLESDNINAFLGEVPLLNYGRELERLQFPGLFSFLLNGLNEYTTLNAHGLSSQMSRVLVSFHAPATPRDQVVYFGLGTADERMLADMLQEYAPSDFLPKTEDYRGETVVVYPLGDGEYLASYTQSGFLVISLQKRLIEQVIDARLDGTSLNDHPVFSKALAKKKSHNFLTLYGRASAMPFLPLGKDSWSEYDFHTTSDVLYLTGETFMPDTCACLTELAEKLPVTTLYEADSLLLSTEKDTVAMYMDSAYEEDALSRTLFNQCVVNLSKDASFTLVADMQKVADNPASFTEYFPAFVLQNIPLFRPFILSAQYSLDAGRMSHIWVFTYKD